MKPQESKHKAHVIYEDNTYFNNLLTRKEIEEIKEQGVCVSEKDWGFIIDYRKGK